MATAAPARQLSKSEKAAVVLLCMDEQTTGNLFNHLSDDEIRKVGSALLKLHQIPAAQIQGIIEEFGKQVVSKRTKPTPAEPVAETDIEIDGKKVIEKMLSKTLPSGRGQTILTNLKSKVPVAVESKDRKDFGKLVQDLSPELLYDMLKDEHPQVVAIFLAHAKRGTVKAVLEKYPEEMKPELVGRIARLEKVSGKILDELGKFASKRLQEASSKGVEEVVETKEEVETVSALEGMAQTLKILKGMKRDQAMKILEEIEKADKEVGEKISKQMFTLEDLARSDDPGIRELLRGIKGEDLKVALKNAPDGVKNKFFSSMSERAASILREDMEVLPPLKVEDIEAAQESILSVAKNLIKEEKMKLADIADEEE